MVTDAPADKNLVFVKQRLTILCKAQDCFPSGNNQKQKGNNQKQKGNNQKQKGNKRRREQYAPFVFFAAHKLRF